MIPILLSMKPVQFPSSDGDSVQVTRSSSLTLTIDADHTIWMDNQSVANEVALQQKLKEIVAHPDQLALYVKTDKMTDDKIIAPILVDARQLGIEKSVLWKKIKAV